MRFTRQSITGLTPPPGKPYIIFWDEALAGFGLRINEGGSRMWVVQYRVAGKTKRETLGRMNTISLDEARKRAKETLARVHLGSDPHAEKKEAEARAAITFERIVERYLKQTKARLKPRSYMEVERHLNRHWAPLNGTPIHKINRAWVAVDLGEIAEENGPFASRSTTRRMPSKAREDLSGHSRLGEVECRAARTAPATARIILGRPVAAKDRKRMTTRGSPRPMQTAPVGDEQRPLLLFCRRKGLAHPLPF